jgi:hypothetical protein
MIAISGYLVVAGALYCLSALLFMAKRTFAYGRRRFYSAPQGSTYKGVFYAFVPGMMPWEKESAGKHLPTYFAGIVYHAGIFASFFILAMHIGGIAFPSWFLFLLCPGLAAGAVAGLALLLKRLFTRKLAKISCADDYLSNALVDIFLVLSLLSTYSARFLLPGYIAAIMMFVYIPAGKIRHCFFFFYARFLLGVFFGRRDTFPPPAEVAGLSGRTRWNR